MPDYIRDGRAPVPEAEATSRVMSANKGKNTGPELLLRSALRDVGAPGYRLHWKKAPGRPDIAYPGRKVAVFVHGCYWHRCPHCNPPLPRSHAEFWESKLARNTERDARKARELRAAGWDVVVLWECEIRRDRISSAMRVKALLGRKE